MKMYLVRHGESEHNVDRFRMAHIHDSKHALTELGCKQVEKAAEFLKMEVNEKTVLYVSPYKRTRDTAKVIRSKLPESVAYYESPLIREWEYGNLYDFNDRPPEVKKEYKAAGSFYFRYKNGESFADVYLRATMFMHTVVDRLKQRQQFENLVIVSHAAFIQALLGFLLHWPVEEMTDFQPVENGSITRVIEKDGEYEAEKIFVPN